MNIIFDLKAVSAMTNPTVREILNLNQVNLSVLATASIDFILTHLVTTPYLKPNLDCLSNPNLFDNNGKLDQYLLEVKLSSMNLPYTLDQLRTIFSEICKLIYLDTYSYIFKAVTELRWHFKEVRFRVVHCSWSNLMVSIYGY